MFLVRIRHKLLASIKEAQSSSFHKGIRENRALYLLRSKTRLGLALTLLQSNCQPFPDNGFFNTHLACHRAYVHQCLQALALVHNLIKWLIKHSPISGVASNSRYKCTMIEKKPHNLCMTCSRCHMKRDCTIAVPHIHKPSKPPAHHVHEWGTKLNKQ